MSIKNAKTVQSVRINPLEMCIRDRVGAGQALPAQGGTIGAAADRLFLGLQSCHPDGFAGVLHRMEVGLDLLDHVPVAVIDLHFHGALAVLAVQDVYKRQALEGQFAKGCPGDVSGDSVLNREGEAPNAALVKDCRLYTSRSVEQHCKQVLLDVAYLGGVLLQTVHDKLDVRAVQLQKAGAYNLVRKVRTRDPGGLSFGTDRFYQ